MKKTSRSTQKTSKVNESPGKESGKTPIPEEVKANQGKVLIDLSQYQIGHRETSRDDNSSHRKTEKASFPVGVKANQEELDLFDWLAQMTDRTRSGAIKWAAKKVATEMGYDPAEKKKNK